MKRISVLKDPQIQNLFQNSQKLMSPPFLAFFRRQQLQSTGYAIAISRKLTTKAHLRNRIKRQLRPLILTFLTTQTPVAVVFLVLENYLNYSKTEIKTLLATLITKISVFCLSKVQTL